MKTFKRQSPNVNAGSMADIAFLLLIFFLVTTTISADKGILRQLPALCPPNTDCNANIAERNLLRIMLNENQEIMIEDERVGIEQVKTLVERFIDNNGTNSCNYCEGLGIKTASDHPKKAVISISHDALTKYNLFIEVQDEITKAYYNLREIYAKKIYNKAPHELTNLELAEVKKAYPFIVSEVMVKR